MPVIASTRAAAVELRAKGYRPLPLPARAKEPPPAGWTEGTREYPCADGQNLAIGTRGEHAILITNDVPATEWATALFGPPNVRTPRGGHWYFRARPGQANETNRDTPVGVMELHVRNKYALVPPSVHPTGVPYEWVRELPLVVELPECPDLRDLWHPHGKHHAELLRLSAAKAHAGIDPKTSASELIAWRDAHLADPEAHPDRELIGMAVSASRKFPPDHPLVPLESPRPARPALFRIIHHERSGGPDEKIPDRAAFEDELEDEFWFATPRDSQQLLVCRDGIYVPAETYVSEWVQRQFQEEGVPATTRFVNEILASLRRNSYRDREEIDPAHFLPLSNGYFDVRDESFHLYDGTGQPVFTYRLPTSFVVGSTCTEFEKAVAYIFPDTPQRVAFQMFCGYILDPTQRYKVGCVVLGDPNIGKSAVLAAVGMALGDVVTASLSLRELCESRFAAWPLFGMLVSICADLPYAPIEHTGLYKQITGGDGVKIEPKGGRPYRAPLRVKFLFGANVLPRIDTTDDTVFGRFLVLVSTAKVLPRSRRDTHLDEKLGAEAPGILQWMIQGRQLLQNAGGFDARLLELSEQLWMESSDPVRAFVESCVVASPLARTDRADVLVALDDWIETKGLTLFDKDPAKRVAWLIRAKFPSVREEKDSKTRWWVGIELVKEYSGSNGRKSESQEPGKKIGTLDNLPGSAPDSEFLAIHATVETLERADRDPEDLFGGRPSKTDLFRSRGAPC